MIFIDNKYTRTYYKIITRAKDRVTSEITEEHHIIPESFFKNRSRKGHKGRLPGDPDAPNNKVHLTMHEHFICHLLLPKMTTGKEKAKMDAAAWRMVNSKSYRVTGRIYEKLRTERTKTLGQLTKGRRMSDESKSKAVDTRMKNGSYKHSQETKDKFSENRRGRTPWNKGLKKAENSNLNGGPKGRTWAQKTSTCEHCGKTGGIGNMIRYHHTHCKQNKAK